MKCLIIEDEKVAAERLQKLVVQSSNEAEIVEVIQSVKNAVDWFMHNAQPDLIFMDIQLSDGLSFEIFEQAQITAPIIFTTAYDEYALKAFKLNSIDYLLKPIDQDELQCAIDKFSEKSKTKEYPPALFENLLNQLSNKYKNKFVIKVGERLKIFTSDDIQCFYSMEKAVFLQNKQGHDYAVNYTLDQLEELLDPSRFFRISRKHIVAFSAIKDILSYSNSRLEIKLEHHSPEELIVSRERVQKFKLWLEN
ncbi:MAG: response regulator transcription factor [Bacteroidales bacterium]|nr:response regulator transcription factor [Bacteroidales bacterium]MBN2818155.1 response regulator transcription factor [Bacteroidales bacterium]